MTVIAGKEAPLEESISRFTSILDRLGLKTKESSWLNPVDHIYSVNLSLENCPNVYSNGKGSCVQAARASALGELFERLATHMEFTDYFLGARNAGDPFVHFADEKWSAGLDSLPDDILNPKLKDFYFKDTTINCSCLRDLQSGNLKSGICSLPFVSVKTKVKTYFPINLLDNLYGSNGMSAGNTEDEAMVQALSEIIERFVKKQIICQGLALPEIPQDYLKQYPISYSSWQKLQDKRLTTVCYDASLGGKFPVVCAVMFDKINGTCFASFGSHPIFQAALDRTLTELLQGRTLNDLSHFSEATLDTQETSDVVNIESHFVDSTGLLPLQMFAKPAGHLFNPVDLKGSSCKEQRDFLLNLIASLGFEPYVRMYPQLGVPVCRIIVPGMSEIYPQDDLEFNNNNGALDFIKTILSLPSNRFAKEEYGEILDGIEFGQWDDTADVCSLIGLLPNKNDPWSDFKVCELKCLLASAAGLHERALEYARLCADFWQSDNNADKHRFFSCLKLMLEYIGEQREVSEIEAALTVLFREQTVAHAKKVLCREDCFQKLKGSDLNLKNFSLHQELIKVFKIIKKANFSHEINSH